MPLFDTIADLAVSIDGYEIERASLDVSTGFTRVTTTVVMKGKGLQGRGEDVTYTGPDHDGFPEHLEVAGDHTLRTASAALDGHDLFAAPPAMEASRDYRRWAFESAILDLALQQHGSSLAAAVGREARPVRFVASTRADVRAWIDVDPTLEFKLDPEEDWDDELIARLAGTARVRVLDFKAYYRGTAVDMTPDPVLYRKVATAFPEVVIEDASLEGDCREALRGAEDRLSFDAPIHAWSDVGDLPVEPRWLNIKPSRFGSIETLLDCIERCAAGGIAMYGGGQFELGPGRRQIQRLASVFYADGPNDVAPSEYNEGPAREGLPRSPLPPPDGDGF